MSANTRAAFDMEEPFEKLAKTYEELAEYVEDVSQVLIELAPATTKDSIVHDNGCGPGITVREIANLDSSDGFPTIHATSYSPAMIRKPRSRQRFFRELKPGCTAFATIWETFGWLPVVHVVQNLVKPQAPLFLVLFRLCRHKKDGGHALSLGVPGKDSETKRKTVTAHTIDMVSGMDHFVEVVAAMVAQGWTPDESERLAAELQRWFDHIIARPAHFDFEVLIAIARK